MRTRARAGVGESRIRSPGSVAKYPGPSARREKYPKESSPLSPPFEVRCAIERAKHRAATSTPQSRSIESARPKCLTVDSTPSWSLSLSLFLQRRERAAIDLRIDAGHDQSSTTPLLLCHPCPVCVYVCMCMRARACVHACVWIPPSVSLDRVIVLADRSRGHGRKTTS